MTSTGFKCDVCGRFELSSPVYSGPLDPEHARLTPLQRAALAHRVRGAQTDGIAPFIDSNWLNHFLEDPRLPSPAVQALNAIRFIGDRVAETGEKIPSLQPYLYAVIGAATPTFAGELVHDLKGGGLIDGHVRQNPIPDLLQANLTLKGWERYELERRGKIAGRYGFLAMKFGDGALCGATIRVRIPRQSG